MSTIVQNILPIPDSVVVGSGSYTIPANKYAFFCGFTTATAGGSGHGSNFSVIDGGGGSASANNHNQWLSAGSSITTSGSNAAASTITANTHITSLSSSSISINGTTICASYARMRAVSGSPSVCAATIDGSTAQGWSCSIYSIPKNNLPDALKL